MTDTELELLDDVLDDGAEQQLYEHVPDGGRRRVGAVACRQVYDGASAAPRAIASKADRCWFRACQRQGGEGAITR